ncbi:MAG TPA: NAD(P)H-hydrate dehydratase [Candidatus Acidoferrales bacterium]|nr:NAD(P)H-hydrate dehydratase [Candidatus Acidoferrales bacterium]
MQQFNPEELKQLYIPPEDSHKGQNGKLLIIGGSQLFHAASLWALNIASRVVDMVFYSSVSENNKIVYELKKEFRNGIVVPRDDIENYIKEADAVLIGPGMVRSESAKFEARNVTLPEINKLADEGAQSYYLTKYLLEKYPEKKWVIDAGALQMMEPEWLLPLKGNVIVTPHPGEFERVRLKIKDLGLKKKIEGETLERQIEIFAREFHCIVLLKGQEDTVCSPDACVTVSGGNAGMTKGGTGDVLAGLVAALACNNEFFLAAAAGSYFNKKAGESLFEKVGYTFNASDLADEIPVVMKQVLR